MAVVLGVQVSAFGGHLAETDAGAIDVNLTHGAPTAFGGLRRIIQALRHTSAAELVERTARTHPSIWNRLFPGQFADAPDLSQRALSPSERRLHRESEQTFWVLNFGAKLILDALQKTGRPLLLRQSGQTDLVSLRAVMRAVEWSRPQGVHGKIILTDWNARPKNAPAVFEATRRAYGQSLLHRMSATFHAGDSAVETAAVSGTGVDLEERMLFQLLDASRAAEERIAAAVVAIKATFFTTNYEGAVLAAQTGLDLLARGGVQAHAVVDHFRALDVLDNPAIEIAAHNLTTTADLRAVFFRSLGVIRSFTGDHDGALATFHQGLEGTENPVTQATLRMYRALTLIKKLGHAERARQELDAALTVLERLADPVAHLEAGWLRNVRALTYFSEKQYGPALDEEKKAIAAVGALHDLSATHLKINLISNISVLQESTRKFEDAIKTWHRFDNISAAWGEAFFKHHRYRSAGLNLAAGAKDDAERLYLEAFANADKLEDTFHRQVISAELGRFYWDAGKKDDAAIWYGRAVDNATAIGDPFRWAESLVGQGLTLGKNTHDEACRIAHQTSTYPKEAQRLIQAATSGDPAAVAAVLPQPRSKLNRPFDLVNLFT